MGIYSCSKASKCEILMAKLFSSRPSEFISGGCIDSKRAYLYPSSNHNVLKFVSVSKDTFVTDSVIDFNHSFAKYANMKELEQAINKIDSGKIATLANLEGSKYKGSRFYSSSKIESFNEADSELFKKLIRNEQYLYDVNYSLHDPIIYRKKNSYQLVDRNVVYEILFQEKKMIKILEFYEIQTDYVSVYEPVNYCPGAFFSKNNRIRLAKNKVHFFPEYTKIMFSESYFLPENYSYLMLYESGEVTANIKSGHCLIARKLKPKKESMMFFGYCPSRIKKILEETE
ncbi:MAG: hypothetical protein LBC85_09840 [Fibromonadaceae bacterium]|jgi:hypothetical protein|nr:hypothetical protein [Fibromonadaceae bacterium]